MTADATMLENVPIEKTRSGAISETARRTPSSARGRSSLTWERAKHATRDAWNRVSDSVERAIPGDSDRDGK